MILLFIFTKILMHFENIKLLQIKINFVDNYNPNFFSYFVIQANCLKAF